MYACSWDTARGFQKNDKQKIVSLKHQKAPSLEVWLFTIGSLSVYTLEITYSLVYGSSLMFADKFVLQNSEKCFGSLTEEVAILLEIYQQQ